MKSILTLTLNKLHIRKLQLYCGYLGAIVDEHIQIIKIY